MKMIGRLILLFFITLVCVCQFILSNEYPLLKDGDKLDNVGVELRLSDLKIGAKSLIKLHKDLVTIPSVTSNELEVASYLKNYLENVGLTVEMHQVPDEQFERYNLYAYLGNQRNTKVLLTSHIDTVPPYLPYYVNGSRIYGRGSSDAKASVVSQIFTVLSLIESNEIEEGDVSLLFVVGEERGGAGMLHASETLNATWEIGIFGEPTEMKLALGHKGIYAFTLEVNGLASHSGYPELGVSATEIIIPVLNNLLHLELPSSDLLGPSTLNIGQVDAGVAMNVVPANAVAEILIRVAANLEKAKEEVQKVVKGIEHLTYIGTVEVEPQYLDFDINGFETIAVAYSTDVPNLRYNFKKRYLYGPGSIHVAHGDHEYVELRDLVDAVFDYKKIVLESITNLQE